MTKQQLAKEIFKISHLTGEFKLRSGIISNEYFDKYQFESNPIIMSEIAIHIREMLSFKYDILAGLEVGGIPIATALGLLTTKPMVFVRKKPKEYGTAKFVEGPDINDKDLLIVEDVVTSGGQIILSAEDLRKKRAKIDKAICVIDRQQGGKEALEKIGIKLFPLFTMEELKANA
ncbi:MAG: orotate phosphoribosyltransferase [Ignavibacteria bacterium]|jgi:orotate phosphoribosyltransferase|nr:orotate phosphoribosyltransferase [Ignavibacteria bacterium]